jgi:hypothetical protein
MVGVTILGHMPPNPSVPYAVLERGPALLRRHSQKRVSAATLRSIKGCALLPAQKCNCMEGVGK